MENSNSISYSLKDIKRYRQGLMSREEMHAFEKASMEDPFLADALEGYMEADMDLADEHLSNIRDHVQQKEEKREQAVVVNMPKRGFALWKVAAMVVLIAGAGLITYKVLDKDKIEPGTTGTVAQVETPETKPTEVPQTGSVATDSASLANTDKTVANSKNKSGIVTWSGTDVPKTETKQIATLKADQKDKKEVSTKEDVAYNNNGNNAKLEEVRAAAPATQVDPTDVGRKLEANTNANEFRGTIVTPNNAPLANTKFKVDNQKRAFETDRNGNFVVVAPDSVVNATITSGSYANTRVQFRANTNNTINLGTVTMQPDAEFEKTVTVVGIGAKKVKLADTTSNKPVGGWESFQDYVAKKMGISKEAADSIEFDNSTTVEFSVDAKGVAKNIIVINTTNAAKSKEIIEAIKKGPKWATKNTTTRILIKY